VCVFYEVRSASPSPNASANAGATAPSLSSNTAASVEDLRPSLRLLRGASRALHAPKGGRPSLLVFGMQILSRAPELDRRRRT
jgi:hypothetical protein